MGVEWRPRGERGRALADLAERQYGVVSIRQLSALGFSARSVERAVERGGLHRLHVGVYAVGHTYVGPHGRCLAAVLASGPGTVLSHFSAAWLWGILRGGSAPYDVTTPIPRRRKLPEIVVHRARRLDPVDRASVEGIPVTSVPRVLLDLAARSRPEAVNRYLERAEELHILDVPAVHDLLDRTRGHHGRGRLRRAMALYSPPPFTRSEYERRFHAALLAANLPPHGINLNVIGYELDVYWPELRFGVELDSYATHGTRAAFERDPKRQEDLLLAGIETVRVVDTRFNREADAVIARIARLLAARARTLRPNERRS